LQQRVDKAVHQIYIPIVAGRYTVEEKRKIYAPKAKVDKENSVALQKFFHN
jgi:hypothetical protein